MPNIPRIETVAVVGPTSLAVTWTSSHRRSIVDLAGWIGNGNAHITPLRDPAVFSRASIGAFGGNVTWDNDEGELAIDAVHLEMIADEQAPFEANEAATWQQSLRLSDEDVASLLGISSGAWASYMTGTPIPSTIARLCRAVRRDPVILHAHLRPMTYGSVKTMVRLF